MAFIALSRPFRIARITNTPDRVPLRSSQFSLGFGPSTGRPKIARNDREVVRYSGFRLGFMPGNLPGPMGVLVLDRFALGPSTGSTVAGFVYHFWNEAGFGIVFALARGGASNWWRFHLVSPSEWTSW